MAGAVGLAAAGFGASVLGAAVGLAAAGAFVVGVGVGAAAGAQADATRLAITKIARTVGTLTRFFMLSLHSSFLAITRGSRPSLGHDREILPVSAGSLRCPSVVVAIGLTGLHYRLHIREPGIGRDGAPLREDETSACAHLVNEPAAVLRHLVGGP